MKCLYTTLVGIDVVKYPHKKEYTYVQRESIRTSWLQDVNSILNFPTTEIFNHCSIIESLNLKPGICQASKPKW